MDDFPLRPAPGVFLIANPMLRDPNFMHTVVLLCEHGPEGSVGLVVNRPTERLVSSLDSDTPIFAGRDDVVWCGGPVDESALQVLHGMGDTIPGAHRIAPGVHVGGDVQVLGSALSKVSGPAAHVRFVIGYAGWAADQLEGELSENAWIVCPATAESVFDRDPETLWRRVLTRCGGRYAQMAHLPPDPRWN